MCMQSYEISVDANGFSMNHKQILNVTQQRLLLLFFLFLVSTRLTSLLTAAIERHFSVFFFFSERKKSWELRDLMGIRMRRFQHCDIPEANVLRDSLW